MLEGLVQHDFPLTIGYMLERMRTVNGRSEIVTLTDDGIERATYAEVADRADRLARGLQRLGVRHGDRVGTFAWNTQRHMEAYMAIPAMGAVLHTLNLRLFADQLAYIANHAEDKVVVLDDSLVPLFEKVVPQLETVEHYVVIGDGDTGSLPGAPWPIREDQMTCPRLRSVARKRRLSIVSAVRTDRSSPSALLRTQPVVPLGRIGIRTWIHGRPPASRRLRSAR